MKTFILKTLIIIFSIFFLYKITIGNEIKKLNQKAEILLNKSNREKIKIKIIDNMKKANEKENYFSNTEKEIISRFLKKVLLELDFLK